MVEGDARGSDCDDPVNVVSREDQGVPALKTGDHVPAPFPVGGFAVHLTGAA